MFSSERDVKHCTKALKHSGRVFVTPPALILLQSLAYLLVWMGNLSELTDIFNGLSVADREHIQLCHNLVLACSKDMAKLTGG